ncbi:MAG: hypothetical protein MHM6MM_001615 [Cercozoa sp. M6MM]
MTEYQRPERADDIEFHGFAYAEVYCSNAKQAASYYTTRFGFEPIAYRGLETGSRNVVSHVVKQGRIVFVLTSPLTPDANSPIAQHVALHGDGVKDVAFYCSDVRALFEKAVSRGAVAVEEPHYIGTDEEGKVLVAKLQTYGDTVHTLVQKSDVDALSEGTVFLPGFKAYPREDPLLAQLPEVGLDYLDHCVGNQPDGKMIEVAEWYEKCLDFHRFWSVDDKQVHTKYSSLRSIVMTDYDRTVKMPINEPAEGLRKSQITEYVEYYGGAGVQHIALNTRDILKAVGALRARGVEFLTIPASYYEDLEERLSHSPVDVKEDMATIRKYNILVDFDDQGYLLQIFTKPVEDRPTLFIEIIQRENHEGFGAGNFKSLFESLEKEQARRGNLTETKPSATPSEQSAVAED